MDYTYDVPLGNLGVHAIDGVSGEVGGHLLEFLESHVSFSFLFIVIKKCFGSYVKDVFHEIISVFNYCNSTRKTKLGFLLNLTAYE